MSVLRKSSHHHQVDCYWGSRFTDSRFSFLMFQPCMCFVDIFCWLKRLLLSKKVWIKTTIEAAFASKYLLITWSVCKLTVYPQSLHLCDLHNTFQSNTAAVLFAFLFACPPCAPALPPGNTHRLVVLVCKYVTSRMPLHADDKLLTCSGCVFGDRWGRLERSSDRQWMHGWMKQRAS